MSACDSRDDADGPGPADPGTGPRRSSRFRTAELAPILLAVGLVAAVLVVAVLRGRAERPTEMAEADVRWVSLAPGGGYVAGVPVGGPHRLEVWATDTGARYAVVALPPPPPWLSGYAVAPDGRQAAVLLGRNLVLHELPSGRVEQAVRLSPWEGGDDRPPWVVYGRDGSAVVTFYEGAVVRVDRATGAETVALSGLRGGTVRYARDADLVAELRPTPGGTGREVRVIDPATGGESRPAFPIPELIWQYDRVFDVSADGSTVAVGATAGPSGTSPAAVHVYDVRTGRRTASFRFVPPELGKVVFESVRLSPDGARVAASGKILDAGWTVVRMLGEVRTQLGQGFGPVGESGLRNPAFLPEISAFAPDGRSFAYLTRDGIRVYDVAAGADR